MHNSTLQVVEFLRSPDAMAMASGVVAASLFNTTPRTVCLNVHHPNALPQRIVVA
jgi:hypothetical protein